MAKKDEFGEPVGLEAAGRVVEITNPDKVMFPSVGPGKEERTKLDLANYYLAVGEALMRTVRDRPVLLERYPNGVREKSFFQKRIPDSRARLARRRRRSRRSTARRRGPSSSPISPTCCGP